MLGFALFATTSKGINFLVENPRADQNYCQKLNFRLAYGQSQKAHCFQWEKHQTSLA